MMDSKRALKAAPSSSLKSIEGLDGTLEAGKGERSRVGACGVPWNCEPQCACAHGFVLLLLPTQASRGAMGAAVAVHNPRSKHPCTDKGPRALCTAPDPSIHAPTRVLERCGT